MELKLGSIPVRVQGSFVIMALLLGANETDPVKLGIWVVVVVVSVVVHELGHAMMGRAFGLVPRIELHGMGGTTFFQAPPSAAAKPEISTAKSIALALAGPFAGFLFALLVVAARIAGLRPTHPTALHALSLLFAVNVGWGIFNLLPMLPLDGGNVLRSALMAITKKNGDKAARVVSIVVAVVIAARAIYGKEWWILCLGVLFAFRNVQSLRQVGRSGVDQTLAEAIQSASRALDRDQPAEAIALLKPALVPSASAELRQLGLRVLVVAMINAGKWTDALETIERERAVMGADDLDRYAKAMRAIGRAEDAARVEQLGRELAPLRDFRA